MRLRPLLFPLALVAGGLLAAAPARAQTAADALRYTGRTPGVGPRLTGMAGASFAGIADAGALFSNPAGLGYYRRSEFAGGLGTTATRDEATYEVGTDAFDQTTTARLTSLDGLSYVGKAPTVRGSLVFGIGLQQTNRFDRTLAFGAETAASSISASYLPGADDYAISADSQVTFYNDPAYIAYRGGLVEYLPENLPKNEYPFYEAVKPGSTIGQEAKVTETGGTSELAAGGSVEVAPGVHVGGALALTFGGYRYRRSFLETDVNDENGLDDYVVLADDGDRRGFASGEVRERIRTDLVGVGGRFGLSFTPALLPLRIGLTAETPTYLQFQEDYSTVVETRFDEGAPLVYGGTDGDAGFGAYEYTLTTPWRFGAGAAFVAGPLTLSADAEFVDPSTMRFGTPADYTDGADYLDDVNDAIADAYEPVVNTRFGVEARLGPLALRGGVAVQPDPRVEQDGLDRTKRYGAFGLSYAFAPRAALDVAWTQARFEDAYVPYADASGRPYVAEDLQQNRFSIGLRVGF